MSDWISVTDRLPDKKVLAAYKNRLGNWRTIIAEYIPPRTQRCEDFYDWDVGYESDYDEETDTEWVKEGWVECIDNWDEFASIDMCEGQVSHWMPLPKPPENTDKGDSDD